MTREDAKDRLCRVPIRVANELNESLIDEIYDEFELALELMKDQMRKYLEGIHGTKN